jgi:pilus assembly protein Flp/PilA
LPAVEEIRAKRRNGNLVAALLFRTKKSSMSRRRFDTLPKTRREAQMIKRFIQEEEGQTLVEYGLLVSLIALVVIAVLTLLGRKVQTVFNVAQNALTTS